MNKKFAKKVLESNDNQFPVATNLDYYGSEATEEDVENYSSFAANYLSKLTGAKVETETVDRYDRHEPEGMFDLRQEVWEEFCRQ